MFLKTNTLTTPNIDLEKEKCGVRQNVRFFWEYTLPETNISPENGWLDNFPFGKAMKGLFSILWEV